VLAFPFKGKKRLMKLDDLDYTLPYESIAQYPLPERDRSRMLVLFRREKRIKHANFYHLPSLLNPGDLLVVNDTRVIPARLIGIRKDTRSKVELLLVHEKDKKENRWLALGKPGKKLKPGVKIIFGEGELTAEVVASGARGEREVILSYRGKFEDLLEKLGHTPLPPYIRREELADDKERYQTIFAASAGAVAAPTAGLHFTESIVEQLERMGVTFASLTLHIGPATFRPLTDKELATGELHPEYYRITAQPAEKIGRALGEGRRVIAVGTSSVRALESVFEKKGEISPSSGWCHLFIHPGFRFQVVSGLITNFHMPRSSLLLLVAAFADRKLTKRAYQEALAKSYRFLSYGDCMLIL
jgi:S-adenosylmethionine:tRNA ribosyltransferase-isomerase